MSRPGTRLRALASRLCSERTMERLIDPAIADLQVEYAEATRARRTLNAYRTLMVGYLALAKVFVLCGLRGAKQAHDNWDIDDRRNLRRVLWCSVITTLAFAFIIEMPALREIPESLRVSATARASLLIIYLTPAALAPSLPIGMLVGTALGLNGRVLSRRLLGCVLLVAVAVSAGALANVAWVVPGSNQSYREELSGVRPLFRGNRELTLIELRRSVQHPTGPNRERDARHFLYHQRLALAVAPVTFAVFAIVLTTSRRLRRAATVVVTFVVIAGTVVLWILGQLWSEKTVVPPPIGAWLSQIVLVYATLLLVVFRPQGKILTHIRA